MLFGDDNVDDGIFYIAYVVRSIQLASFTMYLNALIELTPWKFALDYIYYAW